MSAITSLPSNAAFTGVRPQGIGLDAQLGRLQKELAECVNCASAKTTDGQAKIQTVSDKISAIKSRINDAASSATSLINTTQILSPQPSLFENRPAVSTTIGSVINISA